jgi:hypothetical protein
MASLVYNNAKELILNGGIDLVNDTIKLMLLGSGYTPSVSHSVKSDVSGYEVSGSGYTEGGTALSNKTVSRSGATVKFDADDVEFTDLSPSFRYAVIYDDTHANDALIALLDPEDLQEPDGANAKIAFDSDGILTLTDG